jgi:recombination protein RecT
VDLMSSEPTTTKALVPQQARALTPQERKRDTLRKLFGSQKVELSKVLPKGMSVERLERMALTECLKNPKLLDCSVESWALAIQTCAGQGLYPDSGLQLMYLIPRAGEVTAQRGYQGDIALARRSGEITDIYAEVVYANDLFKVKLGLDRTIEHEPYDGEGDPGALVAVYAVAKLKGGETTFQVLRKRDVMRHKASAQGTNRSDSPWVVHEAEMWKKTAIHALFKWLPRSSEQAEAVARELSGPIDTTAIDLGPAALQPAHGPSPLLAGVVEPETDVTAPSIPTPATAEPCDPPAVEPEPESDVEACAHERIQLPLMATPANKTLACPRCATDVPGRLVSAAADREVGADDDDPTPTLPFDKPAASKRGR